MGYYRLGKYIAGFTFFTCIALQVRGQGNLPGGFRHIIEVGRYSDYGKGYLTITDANGVGIIKNGVQKMNYYTYEYVDEYKDNRDAHLYKGELIIEVDGVSAAGWAKEDFYNRVDGRKDVISLKIRSKNENGIYDYDTKIRPLYSLPDSVKVFGEVFASIKGQTTSERRKNGGLRYVTFEERIDEDFDFFPCMYYDYLITSNDPLLDKEILKELDLWWERNENKPDILLTIAKDANESISSIYIPPSSRVVNIGSTTKARYNYFTKQNDYITTQKNRTIHEGGYTQETRTADIYLEIAALDVKKLNDKNLTHPPIVWKTTVKRHVVNPNFNLNEELKTYASWMTLPLHDRNVGWVEKTVYAPVGISYYGNDFSLIQNVVHGSRAEEAGLMPGDKIIKVDLPFTDNIYRRKLVKKDFKNKGWAVVDYYLDDTYSIQINRNGKKISLSLPPSSIRAYRHYLVGAK